MNRQQLLVFTALSVLILLAVGAAAMVMPASDGRVSSATPGPTHPTQLSMTAGSLEATASGRLALAAMTIPPAASPSRPTVTPVPSPTPRPRPSASTGQYTVQPGDTLEGIALKLSTTTDDLIRLNNLADPNALAADQVLIVPGGPAGLPPAPSSSLVPDSELVYGPSFVNFDITATIRGRGGYLSNYTELVEGKVRTGPEIVQMISQRYSVGPRLLLAILEDRSGWLTNPSPTQTYAMGKVQPGWDKLFIQLEWAANNLNAGFYGFKDRNLDTLTLTDGTKLALSEDLNPGTAALEYLVSLTSNQASFAADLGPGGILNTYRTLWGDPFQYAVTLIPSGLQQPELKLPFAPGLTWYFTGGPHAAWGDGSAWAALDFAPGYMGCSVDTSYWDAAAAPGIIVRADFGEVVESLDPGGHEQSGWALLYMHVSAEDRVQPGDTVKTGQPIGHPSCQGGIADSSHLHFARKYNGEWIAADGPIPMVLSGWVAHEAGEYDGSLTRDSAVKTALSGEDLATNGLQSDNSPQ